MARRGPKPKIGITTEWSSNFAYAVGLIATDGCLYRHKECVNLTSKDLAVIENFQEALSIKGRYTIGKKSNGINPADKKYFVIQVSDIKLYNFLKKVGITPAKSITLGPVNVPDVFFFDFLRGCFDGDGCSYSYWDPRWKSSFMFYISFASASISFITWLQTTVNRLSKLHGHTSSHRKRNGKNDYYQLRYSKYEAIKLVDLMYESRRCLKLSRKHLKIKQSLDIVRTHKGMVFVR